MDIQVGDRVTFKDETNFKILEKIIVNRTEQEYYQAQFNNKFYELLKIERPQYEEIYKEGVRTHHVTIETDKLKELILETHKDYWNDYTLKAKIEAVKRYAEFDNDTDLLEFLEFMEK